MVAKRQQRQLHYLIPVVAASSCTTHKPIYTPSLRYCCTKMNNTNRNNNNKDAKNTTKAFNPFTHTRISIRLVDILILRRRRDHPRQLGRVEGHKLMFFFNINIFTPFTYIALYP